MVALQQLLPWQARLCLEVEKICDNRLGIPFGSRLLLAYSGGADSTAMTVIFHILAQRRHYKLHALHIDHGLREESCEDAEFAAQFCASLDIPCAIRKIDVAALASSNKWGIEEAGRNARYQALENFRKETGASAIVVAHHAGDLCEDMLMRLVRGAGWPALGGMAYQNGHVTRPLLYIAPQKLKDFLVDSNISWREDKSNASLNCRRNRMRHLVIPQLQAENPSFVENISRLHLQASVDAEYWDKYLDEALVACPWQLTVLDDGLDLLLPVELLGRLEQAGRLRLYHRALRHIRSRQFKPKCGQTQSQTLFRIDAAYLAHASGRQFQCQGKILARILRNGILISAPL